MLSCLGLSAPPERKPAADSKHVSFGIADEEEEEQPAFKDVASSTPTEDDDEEAAEHKKWLAMVAKREAEGAPLQARRSRFQSRFECRPPSPVKRARSVFWGDSANARDEKHRTKSSFHYSQRSLGNSIMMQIVEEEQPPQEFDARPSESAWEAADAPSGAPHVPPSGPSGSSGSREDGATVQGSDFNDLVWPAQNLPLDQQLSLLKISLLNVVRIDWTPPAEGIEDDAAAAAGASQSGRMHRRTDDNALTLPSREQSWRQLDGDGGSSPRARSGTEQDPAGTQLFPSRAPTAHGLRASTSMRSRNGGSRPVSRGNIPMMPASAVSNPLAKMDLEPPPPGAVDEPPLALQPGAVLGSLRVEARPRSPLSPTDSPSSRGPSHHQSALNAVTSPQRLDAAAAQPQQQEAQVQLQPPQPQQPPKVERLPQRPKPALKQQEHQPKEEDSGAGTWAELALHTNQRFEEPIRLRPSMSMPGTLPTHIGPAPAEPVNMAMMSSFWAPAVVKAPAKAHSIEHPRSDAGKAAAALGVASLSALPLGSNAQARHSTTSVGETLHPGRSLPISMHKGPVSNPLFADSGDGGAAAVARARGLRSEFEGELEGMTTAVGRSAQQGEAEKEEDRPSWRHLQLAPHRVRWGSA